MKYMYLGITVLVHFGGGNLSRHTSQFANWPRHQKKFFFVRLHYYEICYAMSTQDGAQDDTQKGQDAVTAALVTSVADALDDLGLRSLVLAVAPSESGEKPIEYDQALIRVYSTDLGGASLTIARKLLRQLPKSDVDRATSIAVGAAGIMTWKDVEDVCSLLDCPLAVNVSAPVIDNSLNLGFLDGCFCCRDEIAPDADQAEDSDEGDGEAAAQDKKDQNDIHHRNEMHRKLELTIFLCAEIQRTRLQRVKNTDQISQQDKSPRRTFAPNEQMIEDITRISPGEDITDDALRNLLNNSYSTLSPEQIETLVRVHSELRADYSMRREMLIQKFDATMAAFAQISSGEKQTKGVTGLGDDTSEVPDDDLEKKILGIASNISHLEIDDGQNEKSGHDLLEQLIMPSTKFSPQKPKHFVANVKTRDVDGGRKHDADRKSHKEGQHDLSPGTPPQTPRANLKRNASTDKKNDDKEETSKDESINIGCKNDQGDMAQNTQRASLANTAEDITPRRKQRRGGKRGKKGKSEALPGIGETGQEPDESEANNGPIPVSEEKDEVTVATPSSPKKRRSRRRKKKQGNNNEAATNVEEKQGQGTDIEKTLLQSEKGVKSEVIQAQTPLGNENSVEGDGVVRDDEKNKRKSTGSSRSRRRRPPKKKASDCEPKGDAQGKQSS